MYVIASEPNAVLSQFQGSASVLFCFVLPSCPFASSFCLSFPFYYFLILSPVAFISYILLFF